MSDWRQIRLGEICQIYSGFAFRSQDLGDTGIPVIKIANIQDKQVSPDCSDHLPEELCVEKLNRYFLQPEDTLVAMTGAGSVGKVGKMPRVEGRFLINQRVGIVRPDRSRCDPEFVYCALSQDCYETKLYGLGLGAGQPNVSARQIGELEIPFPPLPVQKRIAGILSAYDALIENNRRRIKILEAMTRALYRETLESQAQSVLTKPIIDAAYWRFITESVGRYHGTKRYYATADIGGIAIIGPGVEYSFAEKPSRAQKQPIPYSVWFARMKETYKIAWYGPASDRRTSDSILSSGFAGFEARDPELWPLLFLTISSKEFHVQKDLYCTGATQISLTNEGLARIEMPLPDEAAGRRLGRSVGPMLNAMLVLQQSIHVLRRTRDLLLPRLLSGQVDVEAIA